MTRERYAVVATIIAGALLRLCHITLAPLHHDEGVNGHFMVKLLREGVFVYDPARFHGPLLYYLDLPLVTMAGLETSSLRLLPALFGIGVIFLLLYGVGLPARARLFAAALVAVSPGMTYFSRYFIHEMMVVFFTLCLVLALLRCRKRFSPSSLFPASAAAAFLFVTKETAVPTAVVLAMAAALTCLLMRRPSRLLSPPDRRKYIVWADGEPEFRQQRESGVFDTAGRNSPSVTETGNPFALVGALTIFAVISVLFYSSFFHNPKGVTDALRSLLFWSSTGSSEHIHPLRQYLVWMVREEGAIFILGCAGIILGFVRRSEPTAVFCGFWSLGMLSMYSLIPYKTPWLTINIVLPFALSAGHALDEMLNTLKPAAGSTVAACAIAVGLVQSISLNFVRYDDNSNPYIYAHTVRDVNRLTRDVEAFVKKGGQDAKIAIVAEHYWPLPWSWRNFDWALFYGKMVPLDDMPMALATVGQESEVRASSRGKLAPAGKYTLRPGVELVLWALPPQGHLR